MLNCPRRIRDLVHGYVYLTELEARVIDHPLFQRLRNIRQNDVAFTVYPSMNTSRFEHSLGCVSVVGRMALNLTRSAEWNDYRRAVDLSTDEIVQVARLYGLLHDVGHLPLSHLFEIAFFDHLKLTAPERPREQACREWFGVSGFEKPHEAWGASISEVILSDVCTPENIKNPVLILLQNKKLPANSELVPLKELVDSEIDADRIDSTARDGKLGGGEYGTYDIDRLCNAVFVLRGSSSGWHIGYSHKAISSIEALLLDRCRTHANIHFHHRVVAMKLAMREAISQMFVSGAISRESLSEENLPLCDDVWLWNRIREDKDLDSNLREALLFRKKQYMRLLWKSRPTYKRVEDRLAEQAGIRQLVLNKFNRSYELHISTHLSCRVRVWVLGFNPVDNTAIRLSDEKGAKYAGELFDYSSMATKLGEIWRGEPPFYAVLLDDVDDGKRRSILDKWVKETGAWIGNH